MAANAGGKQPGRGPGRRFQPGQSGNPAGKQQGTRNKVTVAVESLMGEYGPQVTARVVKRACEGDMAAARLVLERIAPPRRGRPVHLKLPDIGDAAGLMAAHAAVLRAVAVGKLTPEEAEPLSAMLGAHLRVIENAGLEARMKAIEERLGTGEQSD
jgi:hypothetical protein